MRRFGAALVMMTIGLLTIRLLRACDHRDGAEMQIREMQIKARTPKRDRVPLTDYFVGDAVITCRERLPDSKTSFRTMTFYPGEPTFDELWAALQSTSIETLPGHLGAPNVNEHYVRWLVLVHPGQEPWNGRLILRQEISGTELVMTRGYVVLFLNGNELEVAGGQLTHDLYGAVERLTSGAEGPTTTTAPAHQ